MTDYPVPAPARPLWLITLADLALLLIGFLVLLQATQQLDRTALARGLRAGFDNDEPLAPMPVAATGILDFAVGSAVIPGPTDTLVGWASDAARDPRVTLTITGSVDGSAADIDPMTRSSTILAADRARAVAAAIAAVAPARIAITTTAKPGRRAAMVTLAFTGEPAPADKNRTRS